MPGENCAVFGCGSSRRKKGIGIWKLPKAKDESYAKWRDEWLGEIKKTRDVDQSFKELIKNDRVFTCEKHFATEDVEICKYTSFISYDFMACCLRFLLRLVFCYPHPVLATFVCSCKRETDQEETAIWSFAAAEYAKKKS